MSEDLTKRLPTSDSERLALILTTVQSLEERLNQVERLVIDIDTRLQRVEDRLQRVEDRLQGVEDRVQRVEDRVQRVEDRVQHVEETLEQRLYDTRPIWHKVVADIAQLQEGQQRLQEGQNGLRVEVRELNITVREVNRDQIVINDVIRKIQLDFHHIDERLHKLEISRN
jgi:archaellum component FlaC